MWVTPPNSSRTNRVTMRTSSKSSTISIHRVPITTDARELRRATRNAIAGIIFQSHRLGKNLLAREILKYLDIQGQLQVSALYALIDEAAEEFGIAKICFGGQWHRYCKPDGQLPSAWHLCYLDGELYTARGLAGHTSNVQKLDHEAIRYRVSKLNWSAEKALAQTRAGGTGRPKVPKVEPVSAPMVPVCDIQAVETSKAPVTYVRATPVEIEARAARIIAEMEEVERIKALTPRERFELAEVGS